MEEALAELKYLKSAMKAYLKYSQFPRFASLSVYIHTYLIVNMLRTNKIKRSLRYLHFLNLVNYLDRFKYVLEKMTTR